MFMKLLHSFCHNILSMYGFLQHSADQFERLLKEMCADEDGDLIIESAVKGTPKVFVVSSLVSVVPAQPFIFRNYQVCNPDGSLLLVLTLILIYFYDHLAVNDLVLSSLW